MTIEVGFNIADVIHEIRYGHRREHRERERHEEQLKQKRLETEQLKQEVFSKTLDNLRKMRELGVAGSIEENLAETITTTADNVEVLNDNTGAVLEIPEPQEPNHKAECTR